MSMSFYVSPEQMRKDRADFAQKGIARGKSLIALACQQGILLCAENASATLHKISEIYDRIAFAGVGKYDEFDQLRVAGVRSADLKGYVYSREDVDARGLANTYAQYLGGTFMHEQKPMEVEILVVEVGQTHQQDEIYHILYDGTVNDEKNFSVIGGKPDIIAGHIEKNYRENMNLDAALKLAFAALNEEREQKLPTETLEAAVLDREQKDRTFRRLNMEELASILDAG